MAVQQTRSSHTQCCAAVVHKGSVFCRCEKTLPNIARAGLPIPQLGVVDQFEICEHPWVSASEAPTDSPPRVPRSLMTNTWQPHHGQQLKALREAAGLEITTLARQNNLSVSQIQQLEEGGDSSFYTADIKFNSGRKLLRALGVALDVPDHPPEPMQPLAQPVELPLPSQKPATARIQWNWPWHKLDLVVLVVLLLALIHYSFESLSLDRLFSLSRANVHGRESDQAGLAQSAQPASDTTLSVAPTTVAAVPDVTRHSAATVVTGGANSACPADGKEVAISAPQASKPGNYVHVVAQTSAVVCVSDAHQKSNLLQLKPGASQSVYGQAPFRISSADLRAVRLFYQGHAVVVPDEHFVNLVLNEKK